MQSSDAEADTVSLAVENVGGIDETSVTLGAGVTVLTGRNATNRTSLLRALMGALGSDAAALKADADSGRVELRMGDERYTRTFERRNGAVVTGGDPYLDDASLADRFAFLLESNAARRAVRTDANLREVLMGPVDTAEIEREIERVRRERREVDERLDELDEVDRRLTDLRTRRDDLTDELERAREALAEKRAELDDADLDPGDDDPVTEALTELRDLRERVEEVRFRLEAERESRDALEAERAELTERLEELAGGDGDDLAELEARLDALREERRTVDSLVGQLGSVVSFNRDRLDGAADPVERALSDDDSVTDSLVGDDVTCWTCGETVDRGQVERTVERLESIRDDQLSRRRSLEGEVESLEERRKERSNAKAERERLERERERLGTELEERSTAVERLETEREELAARVEEREAAVESLESEAYDDLLSLHREANEREFEVGRLTEELTEVERRLDDAESEVDQRDALLEERGALTETLASLRTRIGDLEREAVEAFNDNMERVLAILEYENVARVWIERIEREGTGPLDTDSRFDLHVVRENADGAAYEDTIGNLSESEREVVGLVFALAGYLVHEVYETVPFIVLDSLEAIDAERIARLVGYVADHAPYLVVALLPEDAAALPEDCRRVTDI